MIDQLVREDTKPAKELKTLITARAAGNPYYTEELVRILVDHGGLVNEDGSWHLTNNAAHLISEVPGTLSDIILARFDHLPTPLRNVLLRASVLGDSFSVRLLQTLVDDDSLNLSASLLELEARDFLIHTQFDIEDGYIFKHPLISETIYKTLLKKDSQKLHSKVAQAIETGDYWLPGERNQVLAFHLSECSNPASAIPYFLISAEKAYQHFANDTAVQIYRQALSLMSTLSEPNIVQKEKAQVGLAQALKFTGELEEASRLLTEIVDRVPKRLDDGQYIHHPSFKNHIDALCELADIRTREGDLDFAVQLLKQGKELLGESGQKEFPIILRHVIDRLAWVYFRQRNLDEAYNLVDQALLDTPTHETEDPITMASLYNTMGGIYWTRSRFSDAIESVEHSLEIYKNLHYHWGMANSLANLGILHYSTEKWTQAVEYLEQADRLRREYGGDDPERPINLENLGEVLIDLGEYQNARTNLETSQEICKRLGLNIVLTHAEFGLCRLSISEGRLPEARLHLQNAANLIESFDDANDRVAQYYQLRALIEVQDENLQIAKKYAEQAIDISNRGDIPDKQVEAIRILGSIQAKTGEFVEAEENLTQSVDLAKRLNDRFCEAKAHYELGMLFWNWSQHDPERQRAHLERTERELDTSIRIFETLGAKPDLQRAKNKRILLPSLESNDQNNPQEAEIERKVHVLRSRLHLPDGEWYPATIFSAVLSPKQGIEEELVFETIAFLIPPLTELIRENGGQVMLYQNEIVAIFGAPITHEDDPERAVQTMMQIVNFYNELSQQTEMPISIHLGCAMGEIVAGKLGTEQYTEFLAAGEPVQLARKVAETSPSGRVWVTQPVYNYTSFRFEYTNVPFNMLENLSEKNLFQFEGLREQILPVRGLIGIKTPFIGREKELEVMESMSKVLEGETGGIIWIDGEAGIGKSRLMREFSMQVIKYQALVLGGVCSARRSEYAFSLFSDLLMQVFDIQYNFTPQQITEQIDQKLNHLVARINRYAPISPVTAWGATRWSTGRTGYLDGA